MLRPIWKIYIYFFIILSLNILEKDNIVCVSLANAIMCLNSIIEPNIPNLRNCN